MKARLRQAFDSELHQAEAARRDGDFDRAFHHLERAHILSQRRTILHVRSHLRMLAMGWQRRDWREIRGQLPRIVAAAVFSRIWIPEGNTGGVNVRATLPMPVPEDLRRILDGRD